MTSSPASQLSSPRAAAAPMDLLYYDGGCGLCHRLVRFAIARDPEGRRFHYAPLQGETFRAQYLEADRKELPDSVVLRTADGRTLVKSRAVLHAGERLGGGWRLLCRAVGVLPSWLLDLGYDAVAGIRFRLFARPASACPVPPDQLRGRFLP